jgi:hypothetical protein
MNAIAIIRLMVPSFDVGRCFTRSPVRPHIECFGLVSGLWLLIHIIVIIAEAGRSALPGHLINQGRIIVTRASLVHPARHRPHAKAIFDGRL